MNFRRKTLSGVIAAILMVIFFSTCATQTSIDGDNSIPVGVLLPLSGALSSYGQMSLNAIELYFDEFNQMGGIDGRLIRPIYEDTHTDPDAAAAAAKKLINKDNVLGIIGPLASSTSIPAGEVCQQRGVPMISTYATMEGITRIGDFIFRTATTENYQTFIIAKFAVENLLSKRALIVSLSDDDRGRGWGELFARHFRDLGGQESQFIVFESDDLTNEGKYEDMESFQPDVVFLPIWQNESVAILENMRNRSIDAAPLALDLWATFDPNSEVFEGSYFVDHYSPETYEAQSRSFVKAYEQRTGTAADSTAALSYEAAAIMANAIRASGGLSSAGVRNALAETDMETLVGRFRFDETGDPIRPAIVNQFRSREIRYITSIYPETVTEDMVKEQFKVVKAGNRNDLPSVAILNLALSSINEDEAVIIVDIIGSAMANTGAFRVLERGKRDKMLEELEFSHSDMADEEYQVELGKQLAADKIVTGSLGAVANRFVLNIKLIDVEKGETLSASYKVYKSMSELLDTADLLVIDLVGKTEL